MIAAPYSDIVGAMADDMGWKRNDDGSPILDAAEFHTAKRAVSRAMGTLWPMAFWRDLLNPEKRYFAPDYDPTEVVGPGVFRFHRAAKRYYQSLETEPTTVPVQWDGTSWVNVVGGWVEAQVSWEVSEPWTVARVNAVGDRVVDPTTGAFFQCLAANTGQETSEAAFWGQLIPWQPAVDKFQPGRNPIGRVEGVYNVDPSVYRGARRLTVVEESDRIQIRSLTAGFVWVRFMPPTPRLFGDYWSDTATYQPLDTSTAEPTTTMGSSLTYRGRDALRAVTACRDRQQFYLAYLVTEDDGQGGECEFRSASTEEDNDTTIFRPTYIAADSPGRIHMLVNPS